MLDEKRIQEITEAWEMLCERQPTPILGTLIAVDRDAFMRLELALNFLRGGAEQGGWIAVSSGQFPQEDERVDVWIVDDNTAFGGDRNEYDDIWTYSDGHPAWKNGLITHWRKRPAPPAGTQEGVSM